MDIPSNANPWLDFIGKGVAVVVSGWALYRRWLARHARRQAEMEARIVEEIDARTRQIQPTVTGDKTLTELHSKIDRMADRQVIIQQTMLDHLQHHDNQDDRRKLE